MVRLLVVCLFAALLPAQTPTTAPVGIPVDIPVDIPVGKAERQVKLGQIDLQVFTYRPANWSGQRLLLVMHGVLRNADEYRDHAIGMADRFDALVVAPKFDAERFPSRSYQRGGILREDKSAAPPEEWTYALIPKLAAAMREATQKPQAKHWIIGHSAGGQFVMRMSAFQDTGAERLVAANPGNALLPTLDVPFGYGFGGLPKDLATEERLKTYLAAPLTLFYGTADDQPDEDFDTSKEAMKQGGGRHQRGLALYWTARTLATLRGWPFAWQLAEAPGIGHDHQKMFDHANCAVALFGEPAAAPVTPRAK